MSEESFLGIDLGTTNCAVATSVLRDSGVSRDIEQQTQAGVIERRELLPSFLYFPVSSERDQLGSNPVSGVFAREQAARVAGRVIGSAKSWFITGSDSALAPLLPWQSEELAESDKISAVDASAHYLRHICSSLKSEGHDSFTLTSITVPASFDESAQALTRLAAERAGLSKSIVLLEEPQAAFYAWLEDNGGTEALLTLLPQLQEREAQIVVVDIGGGTSDFSLFSISPVSRSERLPKVKRLAVSDHILLGGDNIDLALAYSLAEKLGGTQSLDSLSWSQLLYQARRIKEQTLSGQGEEQEFSVAISKRGSSLMASSRSASMHRRDVESLVLGGFYPEVAADAEPTKGKSGIEEFGLPYAEDSAITRHLAAFLKGKKPDGVLYNGGSLKAPVLRERLSTLLSQWTGKSIVELPSRNLDLSVARGAAFYAKLSHQRELLIDSSSANHLLVGAESSEGKKFVCLLPRGAKPGDRVQLRSPEFDVAINQTAQFELFRASEPEALEAGRELSHDECQPTPLPPVRSYLRSEKPREKRVRVLLEAELLETGLLELGLREVTEGEDRRSWKLDFTLREGAADASSGSREEATVSLPDKALLGKALSKIDEVFGKKGTTDAKVVKALPRELEQILRLERSEWNIALLRQLWLALEPGITRRGISPVHERVWLQLAGFCLRPGFGVEGDRVRVRALWRAFEMGLQNKSDKNCIEQWWIMWRRASGGLEADAQQKLYKRLSKEIQAKEISVEALRLGAFLEFLPVEEKRALAKAYLKRATTPGASFRDHALSALGRLGSRRTLYAEQRFVLPPSEVWKWFERLTAEDWDESPFSGCVNLFALAARKVATPELNLSTEQLREVERRLASCGANESQLEGLRSLQAPSDEIASRALLGEECPAGLTIAT